MQREPGKRDYGSSDGSRLRSLASRGISEPQPAPPPRRPGHAERSPLVRPGDGKATRDPRAPA